MPGSGFVRWNTGVGQEVDVGGKDPIPLVVHDDAAVHLGQLGQARGAEADPLQTETSRTDLAHTRSRTKHHQGAAALLDDPF